MTTYSNKINVIAISRSIPSLQLMITNTQNVSMPAGLQVLATVPLTFGKYSVDFDKIAFYYNGNPVYSWVESVSNGSMNVWLKMPVSIPANTSITINAMPNIKTVFDNNYWGCAPTLTNQYGQYDNGVNVFNFYDNFAGTNLTVGTQTSGGGWSTYCIGDQTNYASQNNGLTISFPSGNKNYDFFWASDFPVNSAFDWYGTPYTPSAHSAPGNANNGGWGFGFGNEGIDAGEDPLLGVGSYNIGITNYYVDNNSNLAASWPVNPPAKGVYSVAITTSSVVAMLNYGNSVIDASQHPIALNIGWGFGYGSNSGIYTIQWARVRAYPPNGVMPSVTVLY